MSTDEQPKSTKNSSNRSRSEFGKLLMTYRKRASLSQEELALLASLTYGAIGNYERGTSRPGNRDIAMSLVRALVKQGGIEQADEANALLVSEGYAALSTEEVKTIWGNTNKARNQTIETVLPNHQHRVDTNRFEGLESYFTDREDIQDYFIETLESPQITKRILVIHGIGGIGKSSLLGIFQRYCQEHKLPVGIVSSDSVHTAIDILLGWNNDLTASVELQSFQEAYQTYWQIQTALSERLQSTGGENARIESRVSIMGNSGQDSWLHTFLSPGQAQWFLNSTALLTNAFLSDIKRITANHRIVLMIDTYEQIQNLDDWLCDVVRQLPGNALIVIAGREVADWHKRWPGWLAHARLYALESLSSDHTEKLIQRYYTSQVGGDFPLDQAEHILHFSKGLPLAVTTAVRLWVKYGVQSFSMVEADVLHELVSQLRQGVSSEFVPVLEAAAILRYFNRSILRTVIDHHNISDAFEELRQFPFVRSDVVGEQRVFRIHDRVREFLNQALLVDDPRRYRDLHKRAADYFAEELDDVEIYTAEKWEQFAAEHAYHLLQADIEKGLQQLHKLFKLSLSKSRYEYCRGLIEQAARLGSTSRILAYRLKYYQILLTIAEHSHGFVDEPSLRKLVDESDLDLETQWDVLYDYGLVLRFTAKREQAEFYLEKSLESLKKVNLLGSAAECQVIGELVGSYKSITKKQKLLERAVTVARKLKETHLTYHTYTSLGSLYFCAGEYTTSLNIWREGLDLAQQSQILFLVADGYNRTALGQIALNELREAEASLYTALNVAERLPDVLGGRNVQTTWIKRHFGVLRYVEGNYEEAIKYFTESAVGKRTQKSITGRFRTEVLLVECLYRVGHQTEVQSVAQELDDLADRAGIGDFASRWHALCGHMLLDEAMSHNTSADAAVARYLRSLTFSLQENAYSLDDTLARIFWKLRTTDTTAQQSYVISILNSLSKLWESGKLNGITFTELEQKVREDSYSLNDKSKFGVLDQIRKALQKGIPEVEPAFWQGL